MKQFFNISRTPNFKSWYFVCSFILLFAIYACNKDNVGQEQTITSQTEQQGRYNYVKSSEIPEIVNFIENSTLFGKNGTTGKTSNVISSSIKIEEALQVIDTLGNINHTFLLEYEDGNVGTFYNLVVHQDSIGYNPNAYVLRFESGESQLQGFIRSGYDFSNFQGTVTRYSLDAFMDNAGITNKGFAVDDCMCDKVTIENSGGNPSGGSGNPGRGFPTGSNGDFDNGGDDSGSGEGCSVSTEAVYAIDGEPGNSGDNYDGIAPQVLIGWSITTSCAGGGVTQEFVNSDKSVTSKVEDDCRNPCPDTSLGTVGIIPPHLLSFGAIIELLGYETGRTKTKSPEYYFLAANPDLTTKIRLYLQQDKNINGHVTPEALKLIREAVKISMEFYDAKFERIIELLELLEEDPWALIQNCAEQNGLDTSNYIDLYNLPLPQECSDRLFNMGVEWHHQPITDGNVPLANIDYYGVEVINYPDFNNDGNPDSEAEIYQAFREKFVDLASGEVDDFQFSCNIPFNSDNTGDINWEFIPLTNQDGINFISNNPITSILLIEADATGILPAIAADDVAIIVSDYTANDWTISTIMTANNGTQPFSGNRQWGWHINQNGNFEFFTRAVDVANISVLLNIGANTECQQETYYDIAEATWENLQQEIVDWINSPESNGGQAAIIPKTAIRVDKEKVEELLTGTETIDQINCN